MSVVHHDRESMVAGDCSLSWYIHSQREERDKYLHSVNFLLFIQFGMPVHAMRPITIKMHVCVSSRSNFSRDTIINRPTGVFPWWFKIQSGGWWRSQQQRSLSFQLSVFLLGASRSSTVTSAAQTLNIYGKSLKHMSTGEKFLNRTTMAYALRSRID